MRVQKLSVGRDYFPDKLLKVATVYYIAASTELENCLNICPFILKYLA